MWMLELFFKVSVPAATSVSCDSEFLLGYVISCVEPNPGV